MIRLSHTKTLVAFNNAREQMMTCSELMESHSSNEPESKVTEKDPLAIFHTSGTSGVPRGAIYTHKQNMENTVMKPLDIGLEFGDRHLVNLLGFHGGENVYSNYKAPKGVSFVESLPKSPLSC